MHSVSAMLIFMVLIAAIAVVAIAATVRAVTLDGYRRVPVRRYSR